MGTVRLSAGGDMVPLRLVAFGLLAAAWYLTRAAEGEVIYACHNDTAEMSCEVGSKIKLEHILYKVGVGTRCGEGKSQPDDGPDNYCSFPWAEMVVEDLCGNRRSCLVPVTEWVLVNIPVRSRPGTWRCPTPAPNHLPHPQPNLTVKTKQLMKPDVQHSAFKTLLFMTVD